MIFEAVYSAIPFSRKASVSSFNRSIVIWPICHMPYVRCHMSDLRARFDTYLTEYTILSVAVCHCCSITIFPSHLFTNAVLILTETTLVYINRSVGVQQWQQFVGDFHFLRPTENAASDIWEESIETIALIIQNDKALTLTREVWKGDS